MMTRFVQPEFPLQHAGVARVESALRSLQAARRGLDAGRSLSAMLLAAMVSALVVVADQLIDTWADGHLMVAWVALWVVCFAALGIFAGSARILAQSWMKSWHAWSAQRAQGRADQHLWAFAQHDPRIMAELDAAVARQAD
jgi:hypothetical protein